MITENSPSKYRWYILVLAALTSSLGIAMPYMCMPVLFAEISQELELNLFQLGVVWGMMPLGGILVALISGLITDRFGGKRILTIACLIAGIIGAARGLSGSFTALTVTMFLFGFPNAIIPLVLTKTAGTWFMGKRLGLATGVLATSMGLGFMVGSMISATVLSPLLGGWRNVLFLYGAISIVIGILWSLSRNAPVEAEPSTGQTGTTSFRQVLSHIIRIKKIWLLTLILLGQTACIQGFLGYLPLYLRDIKWAETSADGATASFHAISMLGAIPIALLSDRLGSRKTVISACLLMTTIGVSLVSVVSGPAIWPSVLLAGVVRDGFMAIFMTTLIETEGVGAINAGTALGVIFTFSRIGEFVSPSIGNSLADVNPGLPFIFWAALAVVALIGSYFLKEPRKR